MKDIAFIAPIPSMAALARSVIEDNGYHNIEVLEGNLDTGVGVAKEALEAGARVLVSRGGTYKLIRDALNPRIVEIKVTALDLVKSFLVVKQSGETGPIGIIGFENVIYGAEFVAEAAGYAVDIFKMTEQSTPTLEVDRMVQAGIRVFIGDANALDASIRYGCQVIVVVSGYQAIQIAMENAKAALLELHVEDRTRELAAANDMLTQTVDTLQRTQTVLVETEKVAALGRLVAGVAHELNTPIGNALIVVSDDDTGQKISDALSAGTIRKSDIVAYVEREQEIRAVAARNLKRAADIIHDFKQLAVDQTSEARRPFDLTQFIEELLSSLKPHYKRTPYTIEVDLEPGISMDSFPGPLGQVITNLALNSLVHAFPGRAHGVFKIVSRRLENDTISLVCSDDGVGMDEEILRKIYDPFFSTKMGQGGSGLGMHIVYNIVTGVLKGKIETQSELGKGSCFSIVIPRVAG